VASNEEIKMAVFHIYLILCHMRRKCVIAEQKNCKGIVMGIVNFKR
jgi:hypothetical protein